MAISITATELRARIFALLDQVAAGEEIDITRHGRTVARLVPATNSQALTGLFSGVAMTAGQDEEDLFRTGAVWDLP